MFSFLRPSIKQSTKTLGESIFDELIYNLKEKYQKRIDSKLAGRFPVNLRITASIKGTSKETAQNFITLPDEEVGPEIGQIFDRAHGRLLVVGLPGAGKTTLLLQLAVELLKRAETVPGTLVAGTPAAKAAGTVTRPIPILLNLATWRSEFASFDEWLKRILPNELGASKALAEKIRANIPLVLLLDGLDEVSEGYRNSCLEALGQYGMKPEFQFVISSRINEYATTKDAPVYSQVEVAPLTTEQIELNLIAYAGHTPEARPLLNAIQKDPLLKQAIENPFYLNTAQLLFASGKNWSEFGFDATDLLGRQEELVQRFIEYALTHKVKRKYLADKSKKWLGFLAKKMDKDNLRVFELVDLQPWWLLNKYYRIWGMVFGCVIGTLLGIIAEFILLLEPAKDDLVRNTLNEVYFPSPIELGFWVGLISAMILIIIDLFLDRNFGDTFNNYRIRSSENLYWSLNLVPKKLNFAMLYSNTMIGLMIGYILGLLYNKYIVFELRNLFLDPQNPKSYLILKPLLPYFLIGLLFGLFRSLLLSGRKNHYFLSLKHPNHRFIASLKSLNISLIMHSILRVILFFLSYLPLRLVYFLNEMSRRHLLEFDGNLETETGGGAWRWRHRIIQEYFLTASTETAKSKKQENDSHP